MTDVHAVHGSIIGQLPQAAAAAAAAATMAID
jgi:hypothetical protein